MILRGGLQRRLVLVFAGFGLVLAVLSGGLLYSVFHDSEDAVQRRYLQAQLDHYRTHHEAQDPDVVIMDRFVTVYRGLDALPEPLRRELEPYAPGLYEIGDEWLAADSSGAFQVLATETANGEPLVLTLDATPFEATEDVSASLLGAIALAVAMVVVVGAALGATVARSIVRPVVRLADRVRAGAPTDDTVSFDPGEFPAEVGTLARALRDAFDRIAAFVERERQFTSNASHELRTPVTVVRGATELLAARPDAADPGLARPLDRIRRATIAMEEIIEVFLLLAREDAVEGGSSQVALRSVIEDVVDHLHDLVDASPAQVVVDVEPEARVVANERVLAIVLGNFVRNALQRTETGFVRIAADARSVTVSDTGPGIPRDLLDRVTGRGVRGAGGGHGLGLAIVRTLCERSGWRLEIDSVEGRGTRIRLQLSP
jgi:signal transduction histidine kinase